MRLHIAIAAVLLAGGVNTARAGEPFAIKVVDAQTGRGVPLVELETVNHLRFVTDSNGIAAFREPGLMGRRVFFHVRSHGYEFPKDGFGYRGKALEVKPGGSVTLKIKRVNLAERLYRVTGAGIYRDSVLVGVKTPLQRPLLNGQVFGSDSVVNAVYKGTIRWFWGDTNRPSYPLGNFHVPGAWSKLPSDGGLGPETGIDLNYFVDKRGFAKPTAKMPGRGPTWISGLVVLKDDRGRERMYADYVKVKPPLTVYERGLVRWNDAKDEFERVVRFSDDAAAFPGGHTFVREEDGHRYVYYCRPYPLLRAPANEALLKDLSQYESFTCLKPGSRVANPQIDRDSDGAVRYSWMKNAPFLNQQQQQKLVKSGALKPHEALLQLRDRRTGKTVLAHGGSVYWNDFRKRWVMIAVQSFGTSLLGEVWYAEADTPVGPWVYALKVVTHEKYSFYNPKQHPMFDQRGGRTIYFEGTYTHTFSGNAVATPRYDYNQVMYRLKLDDQRLALPVPIYRTGDGFDRFRAGVKNGTAADWSRIAYFALDRPGPNSVAVYAGTEPGNRGRLYVPSAGQAVKKGNRPVFHALSADVPSPPAATTPLWEFRNSTTGGYAYSTDRGWKRTGFERQAKPLCRVWKTPLRLRLKSR